jgi:hypothetical protein
MGFAGEVKELGKICLDFKKVCPSGIKNPLFPSWTDGYRHLHGHFFSISKKHYRDFGADLCPGN